MFSKIRFWEETKILKANRKTQLEQRKDRKGCYLKTQQARRKLPKELITENRLDIRIQDNQDTRP